MDFQKLIKDLKNDLKSLPSAEGDHHHRAVVIAETSNSKKEECAEDVIVGVWYHHPVVRWGVRHLLLSAEFFVFFLILLSIIKPPFLYVRKKIPSSRNEMIRTQFSIIYLLFYSMLFTSIIHGMIWTHSFLVKKYFLR
jgi:hypothetical protein